MCASNTTTYSVTDTPTSTYCWEVTGGTIVSSITDQSSIDIQWNPSGTGSISVREINEHHFESEQATLPISIIAVDIPQNLVTSNLSLNAADLEWDNISGLSYEVAYREQGSTWQNTTTITNTLTLSDLDACTNYEFQVKSLCDGGLIESDFSPITTFMTPCVTAAIKVILEGPYNTATGSMNTDLLQNDLLPLAQPYNRPPWDYGGNEHMPSIADFPTNAVDWILVEARSTDNTMQVADQVAVPLLDDGTAIATFTQLTAADNYYIVIRHRNHLAVMSSTSVILPNVAPYDFTVSAAKALGTTQQTEVQTGVFALYSGDFDSNGTLSVTDFNLYQTQSSLINQYVDADGNLDRNVTVTDFNLYQPNSSLIGVLEIRY